MQDVKIVRVDSADKPVFKSAWEPYNKWLAPVIFTLEDGRTIEATLRSRLKRDAVAKLAKLPEVDVTNRTATLDDDGKLIAHSEHFEIGARGLVPHTV